MKKNILLLFLFGICMSVNAQNVIEEFKKNPSLAGSQNLVYTVPTCKYTAAPKGYTPFYLSHYGRHGSRFHNGDVYKYTYNIMKKADEEGELSTFGKEVYSKVRLLYNEANGREGDLTSIGAQQHKGIAARMYNNFPEIFAGKQTCIDARSTVIIRSILSMENALQQLSALNPKLSIRHDATEHDMYFMNYSNNEVDSIRLATKKMQRKMYAKNIKYDRLMRKLFVNEGYWHDSIDARKLTIYLFKLATHIQNSEIRKSVELLSLFTPQELYDQWVVNNAMWYIKYANASQSNQAMPKTQINLLHQIINDADSCLKLPYPSASLRYGHDTVVLPLLCLMGIDGADKNIDINGTDKRMDIDKLPDNGWCDYKYVPMACNIQLVFYRSKNRKDPILVKVLRNEKEAHLNIATNKWPYYEWGDVKGYLMANILSN
jgi:ribosome biogenesis protein Nip4